MDKERRKEIEGQLEVMKAYLNGKDIQFRDKGNRDDEWKYTYKPIWNWAFFDYRVKPEEDEPKKLMTNGQLSELLQKGYGVWNDKGALGYAHAGYPFRFNKEDVAATGMLIRPWGSDEWIEPTVDIYEKYVSKWNKAFEMGVSKTEKTASEESSATVSSLETVGVHRRTPQEMADFFNCYVAMDKDGTWYLYEKEPFIKIGERAWSLEREGHSRCIGYDEDFFLVEQKPRNWRTLYRPHQEPVVMGEDDD